MLLEQSLASAGIPFDSVSGWDNVVHDHWDVARAVASGAVAAGVSTAAVAMAYGLGFVPLREVRYDMAIPSEYTDHPPVRQLLSTLEHRWVRQQFATLGGYDTRRTGEVMA